jgi:hypothetical protein
VIKKSFSILLYLTALFIFESAVGQKWSLDFQNQISTWGNLNFSDPLKYQLGARYIPTLDPSLEFRNGHKLDAELSVNTYGNLLFSGSGYDTVNYDLKLYRLWLRYSASRFELRAGLQKINFGSATILRPLMWFDKMDFRDPLQLTDGVYSLLGRYYFLNNMNIWLWTLYGNDQVKGWETVPSVRDIPEYGGRFQLPTPGGELAVSYHHRMADYSDVYAGIPGITETRFSENRMALDGKWDVGPGVWFELVGKLNDEDNSLISRLETYFNLGLDYTFSLGNGLNIITEYFRYANIPDEDQEKLKSNISLVALNYPFLLSHTMSLAVYYDWDEKKWYRFLNMQLKYDYISLYFIAFWNPEDASLYSVSGDGNMFAGTGVQVMLVIDI